MGQIQVEAILSGIHQCNGGFKAPGPLLLSGVWILSTVWEALTLCLAVWIVVKHFRELELPSTGWTFGSFFTVLIKSHVLYFAA